MRSMADIKESFSILRFASHSFWATSYCFLAWMASENSLIRTLVSAYPIFGALCERFHPNADKPTARASAEIIVLFILFKSSIQVHVHAFQRGINGGRASFP